jgi:hypothetical protein
VIVFVSRVFLTSVVSVHFLTMTAIVSNSIELMMRYAKLGVSRFHRIIVTFQAAAGKTNPDSCRTFNRYSQAGLAKSHLQL